MLAYLHREIEETCLPQLTLRTKGEDVSFCRAFPFGTDLEVTVAVPRRLGVMAVVLRLWLDGGVYRDYALSFSDTDYSVDRYARTLSLDAAFCAAPPENDGEADGLFYWRLLFLRGFDTLFSHTENQVDFSLSSVEDGAEPFCLTVYRSDFTTPEWLRRGTMYHIFVDRFCRGSGVVSNPDGAVLNEDWEGGALEYPPCPGAPLDNHTVFGGNLWGVIEKLPYLASLGVTVIYLSPIFRAYSNHKYDTGDYETVDGMFGGEQALRVLIKEVRARGMRLMLDGVFNHTGDDSRYFNRRGTYREIGAYQSRQSRYAQWYTFRAFPQDYECWWNIPILPRLNHSCEDCRRYFTDPVRGIGAKYTQMGVDGWRLDVADELSDTFLDEFREAVRGNTDGKGAVLGEVWENAACKVAYGQRRRYFRGRQLDSVMNYPVREALIAFVRDGDARQFYHTLTELYASYPQPVCHVLMNILGTHDTQRILTVLGGDDEGERTNRELSQSCMTPEARETAVKLLLMASTLQYTVFGIPSLFYGDEAGMEGYRDPFCRKPFPWGREDGRLLAHYRRLGEIRLSHPAFDGGDFRFLTVSDHFVVYVRQKGEDRVVIAANRGKRAGQVPLAGHWRQLLTDTEGIGEATLPPMTAAIYQLL